MSTLVGSDNQGTIQNFNSRYMIYSTGQSVNSHCSVVILGFFCSQDRAHTLSQEENLDCIPTKKNESEENSNSWKLLRG